MKVGVHQGSVLSPLLFIIVMQAISRDFKVGVPWELLYADDLVLMEESKEKLIAKIEQWKKGLEGKGLRVNMGKTKVMTCEVSRGQVEDSGKWPCGVCRKGVGANSIKCTVCNKWIHKRCSGIKGRLKYDNFECIKCVRKVGEVQGSVQGSVQSKDLTLGVGEILECVDKFCYLGDMIGKGGGAEEASRARVRSAWGKFRELSEILTCRGASLRVKGRVYRACVQSVMVYGSETWPVKVDDMQRLERTERMMVRWMCGVSLKQRRLTDVLRKCLGIGSVSEVVRSGRLRWFGHVERKEKEDCVSACRTFEVCGKRGRGRGRKTWTQCVADDVREGGLNVEDVKDRVKWRAMISGKV